MADQYQALRELPLVAVLKALGITTEWKSRKGGTEWSGPCPVCKPKKNRGNFSFAADGKYRCFSCPAKGRGAIDLTMAVKGIGFQEAVSALASLATPSAASRPRTEPLPQEPAALSSSENPPFVSTYEKYKIPSAWLHARGLTEETLDRYGVFQYSNPARRSVYNGSVMLRISRWSDGETVGYLSRNVGEVTPEKPKYRLPANFQKQLELWGAYQLKDDENKLRVVYVVESAFSVMHFHQLGFPAVALLGWTVSEQQADILAQLAKGAVMLVDSDKKKEALQYATLLANRMWVKFPDMPKPDPEKLSKEEIQKLA